MCPERYHIGRNVILNEVQNLIHIIKLDNTMKKTLTIISAIFSLSALAWLPTACVQMPEVIEEMQLDRCLTPTNLSRTPAGESVTFTWTTSKGSTAYILEVYSDPDLRKGERCERDHRRLELGRVQLFPDVCDPS